MLTAIVCATDLSRRSDCALERSAQLANQHKLPLHVINVIDPEIPTTLWQAQREQVRAEIEAALARLASPARERAVIETLAGTPSTAIATYASARGDCLIVLGCPRMAEVPHLSFGSFSAGRILRAAVAPVLLVRGHGNEAYRRAVVGTDLSPSSECAALLTAELLPASAITLTYAYYGPDRSLSGAETLRRDAEAAQRQRLEAFTSGLRAELARHRPAPKVLLTPSLLEGEAHHVLRAEVARTGAELLALGTHGRTGLSRALFGSIAEDMLMEMPCDLLIAVPN